MDLKTLIYEFIFLEEQKHEEAVQRASEVLRYNSKDTYSIGRYFIAVLNLLEFNRIKLHLYDLLKR